MSMQYISVGPAADLALIVYRYRLLFMILVSNLIAIYLQCLCIKLGTVTGMDLAQMNHQHLPRWLDLFIYIIAEAVSIV